MTSDAGCITSARNAAGEKIIQNQGLDNNIGIIAAQMRRVIQTIWTSTDHRSVKGRAPWGISQLAFEGGKK
jgi:hypothetical protein